MFRLFEKKATPRKMFLEQLRFSRGEGFSHLKKKDTLWERFSGWWQFSRVGTLFERRATPRERAMEQARFVIDWCYDETPETDNDKAE
jgi:hypothetical protein